MSYFLGVDLGTSSLKILVGNELGDIIGSSSHSFKVDTNSKNHSEQDPYIWINAFNLSLSDLLHRFPYLKKEKLVMSFSGQMHSLVLIDSNGIPLRPSILWNDGRTVEEVLYLKKLYSTHLIEIEKNIALEGFTLPKLLWVKDKEPDIWNKIYKFMMPKDYLIYYLTGNIFTEPSDASGTIAYDVLNNRWDTSLLTQLGIDINICPDILDSFGLAGHMKQEIKELFSLENSVEVVMGGADNACGAFGAIDNKNDQGVISVGTSGVILYYDLQNNFENLGKYHYFNSLISNEYYKMGVTLSAGYSLEWFKKIICEEDSFEEFTKLAKDSPIGSEGIQFHPYLFGERSPFFNPFLSASFIFLKSYHKKEDLVRSVMEGVTFSLKNVYDSMGQNIKVFRVLGGVAKNPFWIQIFADVFEAKMEVLKLDEGPAYGALLCSVYYFNNQTIIDKWLKSNPVEHEYFPIEENMRLYRKYYNKFKGIADEINKKTNYSKDI